MKPFVLYSKMSHVTGRLLKAAMDCAGGRKLDAPGEYTHLVRWGNTMFSDLDVAMQDRGRHVLNTSERVRSIVNRHHMMQRLMHCVPNQHFLSYNNHYDGHRAIDGNGRSWLARHRFGRWGRDIVDLSTAGPQEPGTRWNGYFLVQRWNADFEVRVHIIDQTSVSFQIKTRKDEDGNAVFAQDPASATFEIRNEKNGWHLFPLNNQTAQSLGINKDPIRDLAKRVVRGCRLDFGCVDFLVRVPRGAHGTDFGFKVLEVNTAPGLDGSTLEAYANGLSRLIEGTAIEEDEPPQEPVRERQEGGPVPNNPNAPIQYTFRATMRPQPLQNLDFWIDTAGQP